MSWAERQQLRTSLPGEAGRRMGKGNNHDSPHLLSHTARKAHPVNCLTDPSSDPTTYSLPRFPCFSREN